MALTTANLDSDDDELTAARVDLRDAMQRVIDLGGASGASLIGRGAGTVDSALDAIEDDFCRKLDGNGFPTNVVAGVECAVLDFGLDPGDARFTGAGNFVSGYKSLNGLGAAPGAKNYTTYSTVSGIFAAEKATALYCCHIAGERSLSQATNNKILYVNTYGSTAFQKLLSGSNNNAFGAKAGLELLSGEGNNLFGTSACLNGANYSFVTASGEQVARDNLANYLTAYGAFAARANTTGAQNSVFGANASLLNTSGSSRTIVGFSAEQNSFSEGSTSFGAFAGYSNLTGNYCLNIGRNSGYAATTGAYRTALGDAAISNDNFSNVTGVGANTVVTGSNQVQLGDSSSTTYVYGTVQNRSDERDKADIAPTALGLEFVKKLRAVDARWDLRSDYYVEEKQIKKVLAKQLVDVVRDEIGEDGQPIIEKKEVTRIESHEVTIRVPVPKDGSKKRKRLHQFFIAQEVQKVCEEMGVEFGGLQDHKLAGGEDVYSLGYDEFIPPMVKAIQELASTVASLREEIQLLKKAKK